MRIASRRVLNGVWAYILGSTLELAQKGQALSAVCTGLMAGLVG